jgi:hypothetical protein
MPVYGRLLQKEVSLKEGKEGGVKEVCTVTAMSQIHNVTRWNELRDDGAHTGLDFMNSL